MSAPYDFTFEVEGLDEGTLRVLRFEGQEGLSQMSEFDIELCSPDADVEFEAVVGKAATLTVHTDEDPRWVQGLVSRFELSHHGQALTYYRARLVPRAWVTTLVTRSRIFQEKNTPDILQEVLEGDGVSKLRLALNRSYKERLYCVQYRESDFAFVSRLMEEEGIFYWFEPTEDGEEMVISDQVSVHEALPCGADEVVAFKAGQGGLTGGVSISQFAFRRSMRTGKVALREFDFKKPSLDLTVAKESDSETFEFYDYPGEYPDPSLGKTYAEIRLQQLRTGREVGEGSSNCRAFVPGHTFELVDHPREALNAPYLLIGVRHTGEQPQAAEEDLEETPAENAYSNRFFAIPSEVPYRPRRRTPRPVVEGVQTAIVTGPSGEEIHVDEHGRVKVHFHWDREGSMDDKSSCWVRVSQAQTSGSMILPRIGWEVIVDFIEGDPDRPIIIGRLHNGGDPGPYGLPGAKTQTSFKSSTSPGGGSGNEMRFEDSAGSMEFFMNASRDMNVVVGNNRTEDVTVNEEITIGVDQSLDVGSNQKIHVGANQDETIGANQTLGVSGNQKITVSGNRDASISGNDTLVVGGKQGITIGGSHEMKVGSTSSESIGVSKSVDAGAAIALTAGAIINLGAAAITAEAGSKLAVTSGGSGELTTSGPLKIKAGGPIVIQAGGAMTLKAPQIKLDASVVVIKGGGSKVQVTGGGVVVKGSSVKINGSGGVKIKGATVTNN